MNQAIFRVDFFNSVGEVVLTKILSEEDLSKKTLGDYISIKDWGFKVTMIQEREP